MNDKGKKPVTIDSILAAVKSYQPDGDFETIERAYLVASEGHRGQTRASGEPYINHPLNVAEILTELQLDDMTISAAILHDVVEDTIFTQDEIEDMFGAEIGLDSEAEMVRRPFLEGKDNRWKKKKTRRRQKI